MLAAQLDEALAAVRLRCALAPHVGVILGSGLGAFGDGLSGVVKIPYREIPHMPHPSVSGHAGNLCIGGVGAVTVACLQGRSHLYEGHAIDTAVFGARLLARLGSSAVLLTNAAGGIRESFSPGTLMLLTDHLNLMGTNPLFGPNDARLGPRFPDMTRAYDRGLAELARQAAHAIDCAVAEGVYAAVLGPSYETPAEIRMLRTMGADAVGMSTVPEVIALRHMGVRVAAISCITNLAAGLSHELLDHAEVEATARAVRDRFVQLLTEWIVRIGAT
ncbi:MAG: purine-nucleoside phosphorylase [Myxococcales bacterium]|nr:purine-nucleoside phosphorylase [Myxococcales bacterium]